MKKSKYGHVGQVANNKLHYCEDHIQHYNIPKETVIILSLLLLLNKFLKFMTFLVNVD